MKLQQSCEAQETRSRLLAGRFSPGCESSSVCEQGWCRLNDSNVDGEEVQPLISICCHLISCCYWIYHFETGLNQSRLIFCANTEAPSLTNITKQIWYLYLNLFYI